MSILGTLNSRPGVFAAGEYSWRGDRFSYEGRLDREQARMASIMCRATTLGVHMQTDILSDLCDRCGAVPARGWIVRGPRFSVCVVANVFCFVDNDTADINDIVAYMRRVLADVPLDMV
ncbi:DUF2173 family protein [Ectothiorhodospiraceae bacterium 2226]|nr:DUF2173 family protein [Ectothiorhodospiraceae bacterium 2226]